MPYPPDVQAAGPMLVRNGEKPDSYSLSEARPVYCSQQLKEEVRVCVSVCVVSVSVWLIPTSCQIP
jgi:hypothetical protein